MFSAPTNDSFLCSWPKVVKCSLSQTHLCLVDDCGRLYMQGCNRYGQLGTGDKIDRGEPTKVSESVVYARETQSRIYNVLSIHCVCTT